MKIFKYRLLILFVISLVIFTASCAQSPEQNSAAAGTTQNRKEKVRIGFLMDSLQQERWQKDRDIFIKRAEELGAEVLLQTADGKDEVQIRQAESLLTQGIDVLVLVPHNAEVAGQIVEMAKRQSVPIISYDRLVKNSEPDLYISFDNQRVGELQAKYLVEKAPKGNYVLIGGAPTDNNSHLLRKGQMEVLQPFIDRGDIKIVGDQWAREWLADEALKHAENALTMNNNQVTAIVTSNDGTAGGAIQALNAQNLSGKVLISGQDAELAALQRVLGGTQTMTVYKPVSKLGARAAEVAIQLAKREKVDTTRTVNNGRIDVPSILIEPIPIDKNNVDEVIKDNFHKREDVYK
jgi:D-xylose transport system substrate-binding protein